MLIISTYVHEHTKYVFCYNENEFRACWVEKMTTYKNISVDHQPKTGVYEVSVVFFSLPQLVNACLIRNI